MEEPRLQWYAMKVFYNKVFETEALLAMRGITTYLACDKVPLKGEAHTLARKRIAAAKADGTPDNRYIEEGPVIYQRVPMVSALLFIEADEESIKSFDADLASGRLPVHGFLYKRWNEERSRYGLEPIPAKQMTSFRLATQNGSGGLDFFSADDIGNFAEGSKVRVTEGPFKGAEGYVKRIKRDRRLLISIEGIVAVATAHIEPRFLEPIGQ